MLLSKFHLAKAARMITEKGDGSWQEMLSEERCPRCRTKMRYKGETDSHKRFECPCCWLQVRDVNGSNNE